MIVEVDDLAAKDVHTVILCNGKIYYDLLEKRRSNKQTDIALLRIEQLYPFPEKALKEQLKKYSHAKRVIWCQQEPENQGAWYAAQPHIQACLPKTCTLSYVGRKSLAAPAVGSAHLHLQQEKAVIDEALS